jgi:hypothetical protein
VVITVRVELDSARTGNVNELARMHITNTGEGTSDLGCYIAQTFRGRSKEALDRRTQQRSCQIGGYPRKRLHVWNLVAHALVMMGYGWGASEVFDPSRSNPMRSSACDARSRR